MTSLIQEKRMDRNGRMVTRWVKPGADNKPALRGFPAPTSKSAPELATRLRLTFFPETQTEEDGTEFAVNIYGTSTFYSPEFAQQSLERLPVRTLKLLTDTVVRLPDGKPKQLIAQTAYDYIVEMYDMGNTSAAPLVMERQARLINNSCTFIDMPQALSHLEDEPRVSGHMFFIDESLHEYEDKAISRAVHPTDIDYSKKSVEQREHAQNYVMAHQLRQHFGHAGTEMSDAMVDFTARNRGQWERIVQIANERSLDVNLIEGMLNDDTQALSEGAL